MKITIKIQDYGPKVHPRYGAKAKVGKRKLHIGQLSDDIEELINVAGKTIKQDLNEGLSQMSGNSLYELNDCEIWTPLDAVALLLEAEAKEAEKLGRSCTAAVLRQTLMHRIANLPWTSALPSKAKGNARVSLQYPERFTRDHTTDKEPHHGSKDSKQD